MKAKRFGWRYHDEKADDDSDHVMCEKKHRRMKRNIYWTKLQLRFLERNTYKMFLGFESWFE